VSTWKQQQHNVFAYLTAACAAALRREAAPSLFPQVISRCKLWRDLYFYYLNGYHMRVPVSDGLIAFTRTAGRLLGTLLEAKQHDVTVLEHFYPSVLLYLYLIRGIFVETRFSTNIL
jgi:hypothetical protein